MSNQKEIRIGVIGNVDSGKSSTIGVLANNILDDGKGLARKSVMKHQHELDTGRTSDISHQYIKTDSYDINLIDLAGHKKYLKTTINGINGYLIDYALLIINANSGIQMMTKEHIALVMNLKIPIIIVYTKIDMAPKNVYLNNLRFINKFFRDKLKKTVINTNPNYHNQHNNNMGNDIDNDMCDIGFAIEKFKHIELNKNFNYIPIIPVSNVTGEGILDLKNLMYNLPMYNDYKLRYKSDCSFIIDRNYKIKGVGLVVSGVLKSGIIKKNDVKFIGPIYGKYYKVTIKNIHNNFQESVDLCNAGNSSCLHIKFVNNKIDIDRKWIKKGVYIVDNPICYKNFDAKVKILHHPTTITSKYQPTIHCGSISQAVKILKMNKDYLRTYDEATISCEFKFKPELIENNSKFIFREGMTKGIGIITKVY